MRFRGRQFAARVLAVAVMVISPRAAVAQVELFDCELELLEIRNVRDVSPDGEVLVGNFNGIPSYWRRDTGFVRVAIAASGDARGVSNDGEVIFGTTSNGPFRWTEADGLQNLADPSWNFAIAVDISSDGQFIVGSASVPDFDGECDGDYDQIYAVRWAGTSPTFLPDPDGTSLPFEDLGDVLLAANPVPSSFFPSMTAVSISGAGETIVSTFSEHRRYRSDFNDEMTPIGHPFRCGVGQVINGSAVNASRVPELSWDTSCNDPGVLTAGAATGKAVSEDGGVVVGDSIEVGGDCEPRTFAVDFSGGGQTVLPPLLAYAQSSANLVSRDGEVIFGQSRIPFDPSLPATPATIWRGDGPELLDDVLRDEFGFELGFTYSVSKVTDLEECGVMVLSSARGNPNIVILPCRDRDQDGLCDRWEEDGGIDLDGDDSIDPATDLILAGADPDHKDVYVEVDLLADANLEPGVLQAIERSFAAVPNNLIDNPDKRPGVTLHVELDEQGLSVTGGDWSPPPGGYVCGSMPAQFDAFRASFFGTSAQRNNEAIIDAKKRFYRYLVIGSNPGASGRAEWLGNDLLMAANFLESALAGRPQIVALAQQGTIMHELGHTLGLGHGGPNNHDNYKPNYHSVMNYTWQYPYSADLPGLQRVAFASSWLLDYSRTPFLPLDEADLDEGLGIGGHSRHTVLIGPLATQQAVREGGAVNFDGDMSIENAGNGDAQRNLNDLHPSFPTPAGELLEPFADWPQVAVAIKTSLDHPNWQDGVHNCEGLTLGIPGPSDTDLDEIDMQVVETLQASVPIDCNGNGIDDEVDLAGALDVDANANGLLDGCEPVRGDCDGDDDVDDADRDLLLLAFGLAEGESGYAACADLDLDRRISLIDYSQWVDALNAFEAAQQAIAPPSTTARCGLLGPEVLGVLLWRAHRARRRRRR